MDNLIVPEEITNCVPNEIYREIMFHNPHAWFGVNKQFHSTAEKLYYSRPKVIENINSGRSLLYIIASGSVRGLSQALQVYQGTTTLKTYAHVQNGDRFDTSYNLLKFIWCPRAQYHVYQGRERVEVDPLFKIITRKRKTANTLKLYSLFLEHFPQERILPSDVLKFIKIFVEKWSTSLNSKKIKSYMDIFLSNEVIKSVIVNNIRRLLKLARNRKYIFEYLSSMNLQDKFML